MRNACVIAGLLCIFTSAARADLVIIVGDHPIQPGLAGQVLSIFVFAQGGEQVQSLAFRVSINDGGPLLGGAPGPSIKGEIAGPGMLFHDNNVGVSDLIGTDFGDAPMLIDLETTTADGSFITLPPGASLLGTITVDTTSIPDDLFLWDVKMVDTIMGDTSLFPYDVRNGLVVQNGSFAIVPEPSASALSMLSLIGFVCCWLTSRNRPNIMQVLARRGGCETNGTH